VLPDPLCVDKVGYLSDNGRYADLLFEVVTRRYDLGKPVVLSTNKAFSEWSEVFPHAACVIPSVDRLIHRAEAIEIDADSYRLKEAKEARSHNGRRFAPMAATRRSAECKSLPPTKRST
jgi:DNA replication protein DnaC